jgi:hypothetical protein
MKVTENRNWNPDCEEHKVGSEWWKTIGCVQMEEQSKRLKELYAKRDEARRNSA